MRPRQGGCPRLLAAASPKANSYQHPLNDGVGDSSRIVPEHRAGVVLARMEPAEFKVSLGEIRTLLRDPLVGRRCRDAARKYFDLNEGSARYAVLYGKLVASIANRQGWRIG